MQFVTTPTRFEDEGSHRATSALVGHSTAPTAARQQPAPPIRQAYEDRPAQVNR